VQDPQRVAKRWDESEWAHGVPTGYWAHHPLIDRYINASIMPDAESMLHWFAHTFLPNGPVERAISLGCGLGAGDRQAVLAGVCQTLDGFDISPASLQAAQAEAEKIGLGARMHYQVADANRCVFEAQQYDVALCFGSLHHIENLEHLCQQLRRTLKPDGYLFVNEYIGPARFQWTDEQLTLVNRVLSVLPPNWRTAQRVTRVPIEEMIASDPSEAVRSDEITTLLGANFEIMDYCDYGGGILSTLWTWGLAPHIFLNDASIDKQVIIKLLILIDELAAEHQLVPSNYAQVVLRNRPPRPGQSIPPRRPSDSLARSRWVDYWQSDTPANDSWLVRLKRRVFGKHAWWAR
jgi:SAM-dependent methyltransferase